MPNRVPSPSSAPLRRRLALAAGLAALAIAVGAGPASSEPPRRTRPTARQGHPPRGAETPVQQRVHTVGEGETLWDIAAAYDVSVAELMEANGIGDADVRRISPGKTLRIPAAAPGAAVETSAGAEARGGSKARAGETPHDGAVHTVAEGETIWDIARGYDKTVGEITARNGLSDEDLRRLRPGSTLVIPGVSQKAIKKAPARAERRGVTHTMAKGETIWDLASRYQVSVAELLSANGIDKERVASLRDGTRLFIPGVTATKRGKVTRSATTSQTKASALARKLGLGTKQAAGDLLKGRVKPAWLRAAGGQRLPGTLRWPVANGTFVRGFGSGDGGYHLAVDIRGDIGWNVRAAAPGIVGYSGNELRGFGNLVMVIHPGGWVTLYGHNSANFVVAGQRVDRGTILAEVGSTGLSRGPHVHFEFIAGGKNCDPASLFRPGMKYRSGRIAAKVRPSTWSRPKDRPKAMRCAPRRGHPKSFWIMDEDPEKDAEAVRDEVQDVGKNSEPADLVPATPLPETP